MRAVQERMSKVTDFLRCQEAARQAGVALPEQEAPIFTNFIR